MMSKVDEATDRPLPGIADPAGAAPLMDRGGDRPDVPPAGDQPLDPGADWRAPAGPERLTLQPRSRRGTADQQAIDGDKSSATWWSQNWPPWRMVSRRWFALLALLVVSLALWAALFQIGTAVWRMIVNAGS